VGRVESSDWLTDAGYSPSKERVRFDQQEAIAEALELLGGSATVDEISAAAVLPVWTVRQRAGECPDLFAADGDRITLMEE
jgi:hypothetical protein